MLYSKSFIPTVREVPADANTTSHVLMIRAGMIRQLAAGAYTYLPVGYRVLRKAEQIVREQMDKANAVELHMPAMIPLEVFHRTGRVDAFGSTLFKFKDQHGCELSLGPTHEEVVTEIVAAYVTSHKQLPVCLYQIQTKFRDEERPKSGILRTREFLMKDAYSFHASLDDLDDTYQKMYDAYDELFKRCGLPAIPAEADSGPIGGDASHEFMVLTDVGEDDAVLCDACNYAANLERATRQHHDIVQPHADPETAPEMKEVETPNMRTIGDVSEFLKCKAEQLIKTLIYQADDKVIVALVRGDHEMNESKLAKAAGVATVELADEATIKDMTHAETGFAGPVGLNAQQLIADYDIYGMTDAVTGANKTDYHLTGVVPGRDFDLKADQAADIRNVVAGDQCPRCGAALKLHTAIEVGHVFKLGTKYSGTLGAQYTDAQGKNHDMIMGCYGIGVNRIIAAAIETSHDENGIIWPISIAPYEVEIVAVKMKDDENRQAAEKLHDELQAAGIDVLLDDRDARPGVKFKDADLLGVPIRVTVGPKGLKDGIVEVKLRRESDAQNVPVDQACQFIKDTAERLYGELRD